MRCRACNKRLEGVELDLIQPDGAPEDLCLQCLKHTVTKEELKQLNKYIKLCEVDNE